METSILQTSQLICGVKFTEILTLPTSFDLSNTPQVSVHLYVDDSWSKNWDAIKIELHLSFNCRRLSFGLYTVAKRVSVAEGIIQKCIVIGWSIHVRVETYFITTCINIDHGIRVSDLNLGIHRSILILLKKGYPHLLCLHSFHSWLTMEMIWPIHVSSSISGLKPSNLDLVHHRQLLTLSTPSTLLLFYHGLAHCRKVRWWIHIPPF